MDTQNYSRLLSYVVCEVTMPTKKHVYNFAVSDLTSMNPKLLSAASLIAKSQIQNKTQQISSISTNIDMSSVPIDKEDTSMNYEVQELCEGTEIEKSALGDILNYENCNKSEQKFTNISTSSNEYNEFLDIQGENNVAYPQSVPKRRHSMKEDDSLQPVTKKNKDQISGKLSIGQDMKRVDGTGNVTVSSESNVTNSKYSALDSDPILLSYSDSDFKVMFKVTRSTFQILVEMLSEEELEPIEDVPLHKKVLIVLWLLGTSGSYKDAAQLFEVSEEAVSSCFFDICATLYNKSENFIKWPSFGESDEIASRIEENFGFPGVVGVLGCQYFTISIPKESLSRREHFNGKLRMYCVALQMVCDDEFVIRDIFPGLPGGIRPAQVLRDSPLGEHLTTQPAELIDPSKHILACSEFPQLASMLTPYTQKTESLTKDEEEFNTLHGNVCLLVDQTFKMLKDRFSILKLLDPETATMVLVTTCVLHNICIQHGDTYNPNEIA